MAPRPRRKKAALPRQDREFKLRLPPDVAARIEQKAAAEQRPQNRIVINELAAFPGMERAAKLEDLIRQLETVILRHSARITWLDLSHELLAAVDGVLAAEGAELHAAVDKLRIVRRAITLTEQAQKRSSP